MEFQICRCFSPQVMHPSSSRPVDMRGSFCDGFYAWVPQAEYHHLHLHIHRTPESILSSTTSSSSSSLFKSLRSMSLYSSSHLSLSTHCKICPTASSAEMALATIFYFFNSLISTDTGNNSHVNEHQTDNRTVMYMI